MTTTARDGAQTTRASMQGIHLHELFQAPNVKAQRTPEAVRCSDGLDAETDEPLRTFAEPRAATADEPTTDRDGWLTLASAPDDELLPPAATARGPQT